MDANRATQAEIPACLGQIFSGGHIRLTRSHIIQSTLTSPAARISAANHPRTGMSAAAANMKAKTDQRIASPTRAYVLRSCSTRAFRSASSISSCLGSVLIESSVFRKNAAKPDLLVPGNQYSSEGCFASHPRRSFASLLLSRVGPKARDSDWPNLRTRLLERLMLIMFSVGMQAASSTCAEKSSQEGSQIASVVSGLSYGYLIQDSLVLLLSRIPFSV